MAVLFTYPLKSTLSPNDLALISNSEDGNKTNNATMASIKDVIDVVDSITATSPIVASSLTGGVNISSKPYSGGNNVGHVPIGGTNSTFLKGDGTWGLSSIPLAADGTRGGIQIGYISNAKNYPVELDISEKAFVNVPWTDTAYTASTGLTLTGTVFSANTVGTQSNLANNASSVAGRSYPIQTGAASGTVGSDHLIVNVPWTDTTPLASATVVGGFNLLSNTTGTTPTAIYTTADRNYAIQRDSSGRAMVNVPWTDTAQLTLTTQGSTGPATWNGTTLNIPQYTASSGAVSSITATPGSYQGVEYVSISNLSSAVGNVNLGFVGLTATNFGGSAPNPGSVDCRLLIKDNYWASLWPAQTNFIGGIALSSATVQTVAPNAVSSTASKTYSVQLDANNKAVVNVPWTSGGGGAALSVGNQGTYFANDTAQLNFKSGDWSEITATSSSNGSQVNIETTPLTGFSPAPLYQVTKNLDFTQTVIGMHVSVNNVKVNKVKFMASNVVSADPPIPECYIAIYPIGTSIFGSGPSFQTPEAVFKLDAASVNPPGGFPANQIGIRTATLIFNKDGLNYFKYPAGRDILISVTAKNLAIGGVESQANANYTRTSATYIGDYGVVEGPPGLALAEVLENMGPQEPATLVPGLQFFYEIAFTPIPPS